MLPSISNLARALRILMQPENILVGESGNTVISVVMLDGSSENHKLSGQISDHEATELLYTSRGRVSVVLCSHKE